MCVYIVCAGVCARVFCDIIYIRCLLFVLCVCIVCNTPTYRVNPNPRLACVAPQRGPVCSRVYARVLVPMSRTYIYIV